MRTAVLFAALASLVSVVSADLLIQTPASLIQCQPVLINWSGGVAPYFLAAIPGGQPSAASIKDFGQQSGTTLTWNVDLPAGQSVTLKITDSTGAINYDQAVTIQPGSSNTCLSGGSTTSAAAVSAAAVVSLTAVSSSAPATSSAASLTSVSASSAISSTSSAISSSSASVHASGSSAISSASASASLVAAGVSSAAASKASSASSAASSATSKASSAVASAAASTTSKAASSGALGMTVTPKDVVVAAAGVLGLALL